MAEIVLDASAVLAFLKKEPGANTVEQALPAALLCTVNLSEVASRLAEQGEEFEALEAIMDAVPCQVVDFDQALALHAAALRPLTGHRGLSLGDRACLALALSRSLPVLTADRAWSGLELNIDVRLIR